MRCVAGDVDQHRGDLEQFDKLVFEFSLVPPQYEILWQYIRLSVLGYQMRDRYGLKHILRNHIAPRCQGGYVHSLSNWKWETDVLHQPQCQRQAHRTAKMKRIKLEVVGRQVRNQTMRGIG